MTEGKDGKGGRSLFTLIAELPTMLMRLVKAEIALAKTELVGKLKHVGIGMGLFVVAGILAFFLLGVLVTAAILGLATVFPGWLAALIVAAAMLLVIVVLVLIGVKSVKSSMPFAPTEAIASVKEDLSAIKGVGTYDRH